MKEDSGSPLISVVLPVYNGERYLAQAIESILRQSCREFELLIINDGSKDGTDVIIKSYSDPRIRYFVNETNRGLVYSLNRGLENARGRFIARLDADDYCQPDRFAMQIAAFTDKPALVVAGTYSRLAGRTRILQSYLPSDSDYLKSLLLFTTCFNHSTVMMRNVFKNTGLRYDAGYRHVEDYRLWTELATMGEFGMVRKKLITYRVHPGQVTFKHRDEQLATSAQIRRGYLTYFGFRFSEEELALHNIIGNNQQIESAATLVGVAEWLLSLCEQNARLKAFGTPGFTAVIQKMWIDTCGNTTLGMRAYNTGIHSPLWKVQPVPFKRRALLFVKCLFRWRLF